MNSVISIVLGFLATTSTCIPYDRDSAAAAVAAESAWLKYGINSNNMEDTEYLEFDEAEMLASSQLQLNSSVIAVHEGALADYHMQQHYSERASKKAEMERYLLRKETSAGRRSHVTDSFSRYHLERQQGVPWESECFRWGKFSPRQGADLSLETVHQLRNRGDIVAWSSENMIYTLGGCPPKADVSGCYDDVWSYNTTSDKWAIRRLQNLPQSYPIFKNKGLAWSFEPSLDTVYMFGGSTEQSQDSSTTLSYVTKATTTAAFVSGDGSASTAMNVPAIPYVFKQKQCSGDSPPGLTLASLSVLYTSEASRSSSVPQTTTQRPMIVIFGGYSQANGFTNGVWTTLAPLGDDDSGEDSGCSWQMAAFKTTDQAPTPRYGHAAAVSGNSVYIYGGTNHATVYADLYMLSPTPNGWVWAKLRSSANSVSGDIPGYIPHPAVFSASLTATYPYVNPDDETPAVPGGRKALPMLILWGGCDGNQCYANLSTYDLSTNQWRYPPRSLLAEAEGVRLAPLARGAHAAVWIKGLDSSNATADAKTTGQPSSLLAIVGGCQSNVCYGSDIQYLDIDAVCSNATCGAGTYHNSSKMELLSTGQLGMCVCEPGFQGKHCDMQGVEYCPRNCSGNGYCSNSCVCKPGFQGDDCSLRTCPNACTSSAQGTCDTQTGNCQCSDGYWGPDCSFLPCPGNCTGHGICKLSSFKIGLDKQQTSCTCQDGFSGPDCSKPSEDRPVPRKSYGFCQLHCSGHGLCQRDHVILTKSNSTTTSAIDFMPLNPSASLASELLKKANIPLAGHGLGSFGKNRTGDDGDDDSEKEQLVETNTYCACQRGFSGEGCQIECPLFCSDHGTCQEDGQCICDKGFTGQGCNERYCIDNCLGHGECDSESGTCSCHEGYMGDYCQIDSSCQGHGELQDGKCNCLQGWGGVDCSVKVSCPMDCSHHGTCVVAGPTIAAEDQAENENFTKPLGPLPTLEGVCKCDDGFAGIACEKRTCQNDCSNNGYCSTDTGKCECYSGFFGDDCSTYVPCPTNCTGTHGRCQDDGTCKCNDGWTGLDCGSIGCPDDCSGNGQCIEGLCKCNADFSGVSCNVTCANGCVHGQCFEGTCHCDLFHHGDSCSLPYECPTTIADLPCSGNGVCDMTNGKCHCQPGYDGESCEHGRHCPGDCNGHGRCVLGECQCDPLWTGPACLDKPTCPGNCSSNGVCLNSGSCLCFTGFEGKNCSHFSVDHSCPNDCNDRGQCYKGKCYCAPGHHGDLCEVSENCDDSYCNGNGVCGYAQCFCFPGFGGKNCTEPEVCPNGCVQGQGKCVNKECHCFSGYSGVDCSSQWTCPKNCSGHGTCVEGGCACLPGFTGEACEVESSISPSGNAQCPDGCKGRGVCHQGQCFCATGYRGLRCEIEEESAMCPNDCSHHGKCAFGKCFCQPGWEGEQCEFKTPCPNNCSRNGFCDMGKCWCVPGWQGDDCTEPADAAERQAILEEAMKPPNPRCPGACSGNGICVNGKCFCESGYGGPSCAYIQGGPLAHRCPGNCSGAEQGVCILNKCFCHPPYSGKSCSIKRALPCPQDCQGRGICSVGKCLCDPGYSGISCGVVVKDCDPACDMGVCLNGTCRCIKGYSGATCSAPAPAFRASHPEGNFGPAHHMHDHDESTQNANADATAYPFFDGDSYDNSGHIAHQQGGPPELPCGGVSCGEHGKCFKGKCYCEHGHHCGQRESDSPSSESTESPVNVTVVRKRSVTQVLVCFFAVIVAVVACIFYKSFIKKTKAGCMSRSSDDIDGASSPKKQKKANDGAADTTNSHRIREPLLT
mmetsp:Transcript_24246/g.42942  ORF Transcript_24246/g.42942 Transcript_24246/m.42942 type:complete len:1794 (-) Transcript_24246:192-5573(-)